MNLSQLKTPRQWSSAIGMQEQHFKALLTWFQAGYKAIYGVELNQACDNLHKTFVFDTYEALLFIVLVKLKNATTNDMISLIFNIPASTAQYNYSKGWPYLKKHWNWQVKFRPEASKTQPNFLLMSEPTTA